MSLLLLGVAVALLAFAAQGAGPTRRASLAALLLGYGAPALFLAFVLFASRGDATRFRFALLGLGFRAETGGELRVPVGGDRDRDGVWVSALAEERPGSSTALGQLVFTPAAEAGGGRVTFEAATGAAGLLGIRPAAGPLRPLLATELADGDRLRVSGRVWRVDFDTGLLGPPAALVGAAGERLEFPPRTGALPLRIPLRILRPLPAVLETYPLAWLDKAVTGDLAEPPPAGFFYWQAGALFGGRLWLAAPAESVTVERGDAPVEPDLPALAGGRSIHVLSAPQWNGDGFTARGIRDRRSFRLLPGRTSFALMFETPEIHVMSRAALAELAIETAGGPPGEIEGGETRLRFNLSMGGWQVTEKSLYFRHASRRVALEALATLEMPRAAVEGLAVDDVAAEASGGGGARLTAATPRGQRQGTLGEPMWLGGDNLAAVQIDLLEPPVLLGILALAMAALKAFAARAARLSLVHLLFAAPLEALVTFRLLLGYRVWAMPPFAQEAMELALVAWALLPWSFLVASAPAGRDRFDGGHTLLGRPFDALPALGGWLFALAWCRAFGGGGVRTWVWMLCLAAALGVWLLRASGLLHRLCERAAAWTGVWKQKERANRKVLALWILAAFLPAAARVALLFFGNRESLLIGSQRFALSLAHVPFAILLEAAFLVWLWRRVREERRLRPAYLVPALAVVVGTWLVPALFANDLGLALLNVPVFLMALAALALAAGRRLDEERPLGREWWVHATPAVVLVAYLAFAAFPLGARAFIAALPEATEIELESERNYLRLLAFAYPGRLERVARRTSEELTVMTAVMRSYTSGPFTGRGYFASELSPHIRATALREHSPAVFVAAEWGLAGIFGLLLVFGTAGLAGRSAAVWNARADGYEASGAVRLWGTAAFLAGFTLAIPSVYMLLANYRLTLFTGKNAYLMGLDSTADVLEVFLLAMLFALGASVLRDEEDAS